MNSNDNLDPPVQNYEAPLDGIDLLDDLCFAIEARAAGQLGTHQIAELKAAIIRLMYRDDPDPILHPPVEGELAEVYEDSTGARFIRQTRNEQLPPAGKALLPCPFCGGIPGIHERGNDHTRTRSVTIKCPACRCERTDAAMRNPMAWLREVAAENWNTRKGPAAKDGET